MQDQLLRDQAKTLLDKVNRLLADATVPKHHVAAKVKKALIGARVAAAEEGRGRVQIPTPLEESVALIRSEKWEVRREFASLEKESGAGLSKTTEVDLMRLIVENDPEWSVREKAAERIARIAGAATEDARAVLQRVVDTDPHPAPKEAARRGLVEIANTYSRLQSS